MNQSLTAIRSFIITDADALAELHRSSIAYYCKDHYPPEVIADWIKPIKAQDYKNISHNCQLIVAQRDMMIVGFGMLDCSKQRLEKLYTAPLASKQGIGSALIAALETIALDHGIHLLSLSSTLNAISFYEHRGYHQTKLTPAQRAKDNLLGCISMEKTLR